MDRTLSSYRRIVDKQASLKELAAAFPDEWKQVNTDLAGLLRGDDRAKVTGWVAGLRADAAAAHARLSRAGDRAAALREAFPVALRARLAGLALDNWFLIALADQKSGKVRFSLWNGTLLQKLLFARGFTRKPASLFWFRFWWRFVTQKKLLLHFAHKKGIWCFYSARLVKALARRIGTTEALEIAAGDGTLSRFLAARGATIRATDDWSWKSGIEFGPDVEKLDAAAALKKYQPETVICSWPPPGNAFERAVFAAPSVKTYIVIGSRHRWATGDWVAYEKQSAFSMEADETLAAMVIPPELDSLVLVFRRR